MYTEQLHRWSLLAPLLILATGVVNCNSVDATPLPNTGPGAHAGNPQVTCIDERIIVKAKSVPLATVLDSIAKACRVRIVSASGEKIGASVSTAFTDVALADALKELLRGCDYLVVYNETLEQTGFATVEQVRSTGNQGAATVAEVTTTPANEDHTPTTDTHQERIDYIRGQIEMLDLRITSGVSDQAYQRAIKHKPAEFVQDDRKLLARLQKRLAALEEQ